MEATVGDRIVIMSRHLNEPVRDGEIVEVHGPGGSPPFVVRWLDSGQTGLLFPGPDARITHRGSEETPPAYHKQWHITVNLVEEEHTLTRAHAVLDTGVRTLHGDGQAHRRAGDRDVSEIGDELAAGRALIALGRHMLDSAAEEIEEVEALQGLPEDARR